MNEQPKQTGYVAQAWLVILLALVYGGALAGVETALGPIIAENKKNETYDVIPALVPGAEREKTVELLVVDTGGRKRRVYKALGADGVLKGWVLPAAGQGFADRIELLVGLDANAKTITGMYVLDQKETPGLGDLIAGEDFRDQFKGLPTSSPVEVASTDPTAVNQIRGLTGATISSQSISRIVNDAIKSLKEPIRQLH